MHYLKLYFCRFENILLVFFATTSVFEEARVIESVDSISGVLNSESYISNYFYRDEENGPRTRPQRQHRNRDSSPGA